VSIAETHLEDFVVDRLEEIETGLRLVKRQLSTKAGRLDLLCQDARGNYVVIELKSTRGSDQVVGQILRYMGWAKEEYPQAGVRGVIIVGKKDAALEYALKAIPDV
jgi:RecB family endonuclease NucS